MTNILASRWSFTSGIITLITTIKQFDVMKHDVRNIAFCILALLTLMPLNASALNQHGGFTSGHGTAADPYIIDDVNALRLLSYVSTMGTTATVKDADGNGQLMTHYNLAYYALTKDLDFGSTADNDPSISGDTETDVFTPISALNNSTKYASVNFVFRGHFDGQGHTIKNFRVKWKVRNDNTGTYKNVTLAYGLFGCVGCTSTTKPTLVGDASGSRTVIENLIIENATLEHDASEGAVRSLKGNSVSYIQHTHLGILAGVVTCNTLIQNIIVRNSRITDATNSNTYTMYTAKLRAGGIIGTTRNTYLGSSTGSPAKTIYTRLLSADCDISLTHAAMGGTATTTRTYFSVGGLIGGIETSGANSTINFPSYCHYSGTINAPLASVSPTVGSIHSTSGTTSVGYATISKRYMAKSSATAAAPVFTNASYSDYKIHDTSDANADGDGNVTITADYPTNVCTFGARTLETHTDASGTAPSTYAFQGVNYGTPAAMDDALATTFQSGVDALSADADYSYISVFDYAYDSSINSLTFTPIATSISDNYLGENDPSHTHTITVKNYTAKGNVYTYLFYDNGQKTTDEGTTTNTYTITPDARPHTIYCETYKDGVLLETTESIVVPVVTLSVSKGFESGTGYAFVNDTYKSDNLPAGVTVTYTWELNSGTSVGDYYTDEEVKEINQAHQKITNYTIVTNRQLTAAERTSCGAGTATSVAGGYQYTCTSVPDFDDSVIIASFTPNYTYDGTTPVYEDGWTPITTADRKPGEKIWTEQTGDGWTSSTATLVDGKTYRCTVTVTDSQIPTNTQTVQVTIVAISSNVIYICPVSGYAADGTAVTGDDENNDGLTDKTPVLTWTKAYSLLNADADWTQNYIVLIGTSNTNTFNNIEGTGTYASWYSNGASYRKQATITGLSPVNDHDYDGHMYVSTHNNLWANTRIENITITGGAKYSGFYCQGYDLEMGEGIIMEKLLAADAYDKVTTNSGNEGGAFRIWGGVNVDQRFKGTASTNTSFNYDQWAAFVEATNGKKGQTITIKSGHYSIISVGSRQTSSASVCQGHPSLPIKCKVIIDIDDTFNDQHKQCVGTGNTDTCPYDVNILLAGNHEGCQYGDEDLIVRAGRVARIIAGSLGADTNISYKVGSTTYYYPINAYIGRCSVLVDPANSRLANDGESAATRNARALVTEIYNGGVGRDKSGGAVNLPFYGKATMTINGGTIACSPYLNDAQKAMMLPGVYGSGAGGASGIGDSAEHSADISSATGKGVNYTNGGRYPYWSTTKDDHVVLYGNYATYKSKEGTDQKLYVDLRDDDGNVIENLDLSHTTSTVTITGGVFGSETDNVNIFAGGSGYTTLNFLTNGGYNSVRSGNIYAQPGDTPTHVYIKGGEFYGNIYGGGRGTAEYYYGTRPANSSVKVGDVTGYANYDKLGQIYGNVEVNITGGTVHGSVYAGGLGVADCELGKDATNIGTLSEMALISGTSRLTISGNVHITGNVYGGGDRSRIINEIKDADGNVTGYGDASYVTIKGGAQIDGSVFGAGNGRPANDAGHTGGYSNQDYTAHPELVGMVTGSTHVTIEGTPNISGNVFGGGNYSYVSDMAYVDFKGGTVMQDIFGGGNKAPVGTVASTTAADGDQTAAGSVARWKWAAKCGTHVTVSGDNTKAYSDIYGGGKEATVHGSTYVGITSGQFAGDIYGGGKGVLNADGTCISADVDANATVYVNGTDVLWNYKYDSESDAIISWDGTWGGTNRAKFVTGTESAPLWETLHNCYGGGNLACTVADTTFVTMKRGFTPATLINTTAWRNAYNDDDHPHFCCFGGGYGVNTTVGNTIVDVAIENDSEDIYNASINDNKYGVAYTTVLSVLGGGFSGVVTGNTDVTVSNVSFTHNIYGGGFGNAAATSSDNVETNYHDVGKVSGNTSVQVNGGFTYGSVYGGGARGIVLGTTNVEIADTARIYGNVYGGGEIANVHGYKLKVESGELKVISAVDAAADTTAIVTFSGGNTYGNAFGGGSKGNILGNTQVHMYNYNDGDDEVVPYIWQDIYGGGEAAAVTKSTHVIIDGGMMGDNVFGGGLGSVNGEAVITSADVYGNTYVTINGGAMLTNRRYRDGVFMEWTDYSVKNTDFFNNMTSRLTDNHNIYGGGNAACVVVGDSYVSLLGRGPVQDINTKNLNVMKRLANNGYAPQFCVFGGGYGVNTKVYGNSNVDVSLGIDPATGNKLYWAEDLTPKTINALYAYGPSLTMMDVVGGGFNGTVGFDANNPDLKTNSTHVHIGGNTMLRNVYGGGYYAPVTNSEVSITGGKMNNVYGGGLMGDISAGAATVNIGLQSGDADGLHSSVTAGGRNYTYASEKNNSRIYIFDAVYGGNDVSGIVPHAYTNIYGGTIGGTYLAIAHNGDVYGAGNGDYEGYYDPDYTRYSDGLNDNYYVNHKSYSTTEMANIYKYRPHTYEVTMNVMGNSEEDRVNIGGRMFGGGNSTNIGYWDADLRDAYTQGESAVVAYKTAKGYADTKCYGKVAASVNDDPNYFLGGGKLSVNIGSHVTIGNMASSFTNTTGLYLGSNGHHLLTQNLMLEDGYYHRFFDENRLEYLPGFDTSVDDATGNEIFRAYCNNVLNNCEVKLLFTDTPDTEQSVEKAGSITDTEIANFVVGGYRGSMKAYVGDDKKINNYYFNLPPGLTVTNNIIGGSFNALALYHDYNYDINVDEDVYYSFAEGSDEFSYYGNDPQTEIANEFGVTMKGHERYRFVGGILGGEPGGVLKSNTTYLDYALNNWKDQKGWDKQALVRLNLNCRMRPTISKVNGVTYYYGANIFGGCYTSGATYGDVWIGNSTSPHEDCDVNLRTLTTEALALSQYIDDQHFLLRTYGGGYGQNTEVYGNTYVHLQRDYRDTKQFVFAYNVFGGSHRGTVFGSTHVEFHGDQENGQRDQLVGNIYGGGVQGDILGNQNGSTSTPNVVRTSLADTTIPSYVKPADGTLGSDGNGLTSFKAWGNCLVHIDGGLVTKAYGGAREADVDGGTHVYISESTAHLGTTIVSEVYGGNDHSGTVKGMFPAYYLGYNNGSNAHDYYDGISFKNDLESSDDRWVETPYTNDITASTKNGTKYWPGVNCYVQVGGTLGTSKGFPIIGKIFAGGDGSQYSAGDDAANPAAKPEVASAILDISGGTICQAFGGGNMANVTERNYIRVNNVDPELASYTALGGSAGIALARYYTQGAPYNMYTLKNGTFSFNYHIGQVFGGNNFADMSIQPRWDLCAGSIYDVFSGGNYGRMTYYNPSGVAAEQGKISDPYSAVGDHNTGAPRGITITIDHPDISIANLYGGSRIADVVTLLPEGMTAGDGDVVEDINGEKRVTLADGYYGATVNVCDGNVQNVYGGNDIACNVYNGSNVNINGVVTGSVYCAGNGDYIYRYNPDVTQVTNVIADGYTGYTGYVDLPTPEGWTKADGVSDEVNKLQILNSWRPNATKSYLNIFGQLAESGEEKLVYVGGGVYCGGNSSTVLGNTTRFDIGDNVVLNSVFMGSNGENLVKMSYAKQINDINGLDLTNLQQLTEYMKAVETDAVPTNFSLDPNIKEAYIGTFCMGGNAGSMATDKPVSMTFPSNITIFDKIIGGCNNSAFTYGTTTFSGGYYNANVDDPATVDDDESEDPKITLNVFSRFEPHKMKIPARSEYDSDEAYTTAFNAAKQNKFLTDVYLSAGDDGYNSKAEGKTYIPEICNIFGGCYASGIVRGDVHVHSYANMLEDFDKASGTITSEQKYEYLDNTNDLFTSGELIPAFSIFGAGYGAGTYVYGNTMVEQNTANNPRTLWKATGTPGRDGSYSGSWAEDLTSDPRTIPDTETRLTNANFAKASCNNILGGGARGNLVGHTTVNVFNGTVHADVVGASYSGTIYGSTRINVGYSTFYESDQQFAYQMKRSNDTQAELDYKNADGTSTIRQEIKLLKGERTNEAVYKAIITYDQEMKYNDSQAQGRHFKLEQFRPKDWNFVDINIGKGVYGGGYATSGFSTLSAAAGSNTVVEYDAEHNNDNSAINGYGGNSTIFITDQVDANNWNSVDEHDRKEHIVISSRVLTSIGTLTASQISTTPLAGIYYKGTTVAGADYYAPEYELTTGKEYYKITGEGGVYGDGHKSLVQNVRTASIHGYGYAQHTPDKAQILNTFQRLDLLRVEDCCIATFGARDFTSVAISTDGSTESIKIDDIDYSICRIGEMVMQSNIANKERENLDKPSELNSRNCVNFYSPVWYLGGITSNIAFDNSNLYHDGNGAIDGNNNSYFDYKRAIVNTYFDYDNMRVLGDTQAQIAANELEFNKRNIGTALNMIRVNNTNGDALYLKHVREGIKAKDSEYEDSYYGHIKGVCQIDLLSYDTSLGGGYVYAANKHADYNTEYEHDANSTAMNFTQKHNFMHSEGNFVFATGEAVNNQYTAVDLGSTLYAGTTYYYPDGDDMKAYTPANDETCASAMFTKTDDKRFVLDDCYADPYGTKNSAAAVQGADGSSDDGCDVHESEAHYWYVSGTKYIYSPTVTGYTFNDSIRTFTTNNLTGVMTLLNMKKGSDIRVKSIRWMSNHSDGYVDDIENSDDTESAGHKDGYSEGTLINPAEIPYRLKFSVDNKKGWSNKYQTYGENANILGKDAAYSTENPILFDYSSSTATGEGHENTPASPILTIMLEDNVNNNGYNDPTDNYYTKYLSEPCYAEIELEADGEGNKTITYLIYLTINYIASPVVEGALKVNCTLPGEYATIDASSVKMYRTDKMPYSGCTWLFYPSKENARNADGTPNDAYSEGRTVSASWSSDGQSVYFPSRYFINGGRIRMNCNFTNFSSIIPVYCHPVATDGTVDYTKEATITVHNYHDISVELNDADYMMLYTSGARIYIKDRAGWNDFVKYCKRSDPAMAYGSDPDVQMMLTKDGVHYTEYPVDTDNDGVADTTVPVTAGLVKQIADEQYGVNAYPWYCEGLKFYLQSDIDLSDADPEDVCIANKFLGQLNGDGYHVILPKGATALFTGNTGVTDTLAYNLAVVGGKTGLVNENCLENAGTAADDASGKTAYILSHKYSMSDTKGYAYEDRFAGEDWQYAHAISGDAGYNGDKRYLRTGEPNYQGITTNHNTDHTAAETCDHDYRFFGQSLQGEASTGVTPGSDVKHETYPQHLDDAHDQYYDTYGDDKWTEANRVWGAEGFYQSKEDLGFYYNKDAWVLNNMTTAVKFTDHSYDAPDDLTGFHVVNDADNSSINASGVTKNLLVYSNKKRNTGDNGIFFDAVKLSSADANGNDYAVADLALYDREDFNAPVAFTATKASYVRTPSDETGFVETSGTAWSSICLPFDVTKTTLSEGITRAADGKGNGTTGKQTDITFFFGSAEEPTKAQFERNDINHEYWLRTMSAVTTESGKTMAAFKRPATQVFKAYTPHIVSFPGSQYYEFDMTGQTITFSATDAMVAVTDDAVEQCKSTADGYCHVGAFINEAAADGIYAIDTKADNAEAAGDKFQDNKTVYPFRSYMYVDDGSNNAKSITSHTIYIASATGIENISFEAQDDDQDEVQNGMLVYPLSNGRIGITATEDTVVSVYTIGGQLIRVLDVREGKQTYSGFKPGMYIVGQKKLRVK